MGSHTTEALPKVLLTASSVKRFELLAVEGPAARTSQPLKWISSSAHCSVGSHDANDVVLEDPTVSRFHCEIRIEPQHVQIKDLGSRNGTVVDGASIRDADLRDGSLIRLGRSVLRFSLSPEMNPLPISERSKFGSLVGSSAAMRSAFALLERAAATDSTVLIEGETGTGKEHTAASIHDASARRDRPLMIVDLAAIPPNLLESELFGHEKGAFTGALSRRIGAFEDARGGTIFLDEIGELPLELQPKLLRALDQRQVRRVGSNTTESIDVRVIAATNRDLRIEVNQGRFRSDLYYRLAVVKIRLPPLRERPEDIPLLASTILGSLQLDPSARDALLSPELLARLEHAAWPGNVRELRNYLERCVVFQQPMPLADELAGRDADGTRALESDALDASLSYPEARRRALERWEREYLARLLARHGGSVDLAAAGAGIGRAYLYRLLGRHRDLMTSRKGS